MSSSSSSSSVLQGFQSSLEPLLMEPRVLRLKLSPTEGSNPDSDVKEKPFNNTITNDEHSMNSDKHSWSFIQPLSNICNKTEDPEGENVYVHPTVKFSSSMLSAKSLEMCTENLGCETGSNDSDSSDEMSLFSSEHSSGFIGDSDTHIPVVEVNRNFNYMSKKLNKSNNFPPPLTSLTDFGGVQVRPYREDGRLILEAVTSSSPQPYFQAERSNGRLRLRLFDSVNDEDDDDDDDDEEDEVDYDGEEEACDEEESGSEEEYIENGEDITKFGRPRRCKESGNRDIFGDGYFELHSLSLCL